MLDYIEQVVGLEFEVTPIRDCGEIIGAVLIRASEVHVGVKRVPKVSMRRMVRDILSPIIERYGFAMTLVKHDNPAGRLFCRRLGFHAARSTEDATLYICIKANHA